MAAKQCGLVALAAAMVGAASAQEPRFALHANIALAAGDLSFGTAGTTSVLSRDVSFDASYSLDSAVGFDLGLQVALTNALGVRLSVSHATREGNGTLSAELPPLPFGLPSHIDATLPDGRVEETAGHIDLVVGGGLGGLRASAFGGVTLFDLEARLLGAATVMVPGLPPIPIGSSTALVVSDSPTGWNVGAGLDFGLSSHLGLGGFVRYAHANARLEPPGFEAAEVDAGGVHIAGGLRLLF